MTPSLLLERTVPDRRPAERRLVPGCRVRALAPTRAGTDARPTRDVFSVVLGCAVDAEASAAYGLGRPVCTRHGVAL